MSLVSFIGMKYAVFVIRFVSNLQFVFFSYIDVNLRLPLSVSDITVYMIHKHKVRYVCNL